MSHAPHRPPRPSLAASFGFALDGVLRTLVGERNMKIHWVSGVAVALVGMALPLPLSARAALLFALVLVLGMEVLNAAVEALVDLLSERWDYDAKRAKDAAAGTVLLVALGASLLLADVLLHHWDVVLASRSAIVRTIVLGVPLLGAVTALLVAPRRRAWMAAAGATAIVGFLPLAAASADLVFTLAGALLLFGAAQARAREPALLDRRPPAGARGRSPDSDQRPAA